MKNKANLRKFLFIALSFFSVNMQIIAQGNNQNNSNGLWQAIGNDTVTTSREVLIKEDIIIKGVTTSDTLKANVIKVGKNSLWIGNPGLQTQIGTSDLIQSDNGNILLGNTDIPTFDDIKIGIGTLYPFTFDPTLRGLEVTGDINITSANMYPTFLNHGFRINGVTVLQTQKRQTPPYNSTGNIFVGENAGYTWWDGNSNKGNFNTYLGYEAGYSTSFSGYNTFIGSSAGRDATTELCILIGWDCGKNLSQPDNIFIGNKCGTAFQGANNVLIGNQVALNSSGQNTANTVVGRSAGYKFYNSSYNTIMGEQSVPKLLNAEYNTFIGYKTGGNDITNVTGDFNTVVGNESGFNITSGLYNTFIGNESGQQLTQGQHNTFIGNKSGNTNITGFYNTTLGSFADVASANLQNSTAIGYRAYVSAPNCMVLGGITGWNGGTNVNVGIGTHAPANRLEIATTHLTGTSGLRLSALAGTSPVNVNVNGVLSVNPSNGDVILVSGGGCNTTICNTISDNYLTKKISKIL